MILIIDYKYHAVYVPVICFQDLDYRVYKYSIQPLLYVCFYL